MFFIGEEMQLLQIMEKLRPVSLQAEEIQRLVENGFKELADYSELVVYTYHSPANVKNKVVVLVFEYNGKTVAAHFPVVYNFTELNFHMVTGVPGDGIISQLLDEVYQNKISPRTKTDLLGTPELRFETACKIIQYLIGD